MKFLYVVFEDDKSKHVTQYMSIKCQTEIVYEAKKERTIKRKKKVRDFTAV
jgi:hypothetical protein